MLIIIIFVIVPVSFVDTSAVQRGKEGDNVTLRCEVKGGVKPVITWSVAEGALLGEENFPVSFFLFFDHLAIVFLKMHIKRNTNCEE